MRGWGRGMPVLTPPWCRIEGVSVWVGPASALTSLGAQDGAQGTLGDRLIGREALELFLQGGNRKGLWLDGGYKAPAPI